MPRSRLNNLPTVFSATPENCFVRTIAACLGNATSCHLRLDSVIECSEQPNTSQTTLTTISNVALQALTCWRGLRPNRNASSNDEIRRLRPSTAKINFSMSVIRL